MSRVTACIAVTLAMVVGAAPASVSAQERSMAEMDLVRRIDSLLSAMPDTPEYERQMALAEAARREEWARRLGGRDVPFDTARVGPFSIFAPQDQLEEATELYHRAWSRYLSSVGDASLLLGDITLSFQISKSGFRIRNSTTRHQSLQLRPWTSAAEKEIGAAGAIAMVLGRLMPPDLLAWSGAMPMLGTRPGGKRPTFRWPEFYQVAYRDLATRPARAVSRCFGADLDACLMALGLDEDASWEDLYTLEEIQMIVREAPMGNQDQQDARWACLSEPDFDTCVALVAERWPDAFVPLKSPVRISLLLYALEAGGDGAFSRLISEDERSTSERLEHASGIGIHELVAAWRARVMESRPEVTAGLPLSVSVALFWIGLMSFFSLRSTRWRV